jgi:ElaB/YqjD/DUF883 family membrane-anchored ribosome-binding protein
MAVPASGLRKGAGFDTWAQPCRLKPARCRASMSLILTGVLTMTESSQSAPTTGRVADSLHDAVDAAAAKAGSAEEQLRQQAEKAREAADYARARAGEVVDSVARYTRDNPLAALGIAFAAGVVLASLTRR